ncbi:unknown [Gryllus bimaculatus nudivirus]|uniref:Uncharacterized protein n=1 Tax=Gryllus bimaculatus nudivirus TaxID=432587 RepID=A4L246_9VIRU|nr:hypothetical protein GrBNV_gp83 [Gryllus bimaculatus nudivirus]ABO45416.1 unknown [Gryllus bimaculatus nudivirus]
MIITMEYPKHVNHLEESIEYLKFNNFVNSKNKLIIPTDPEHFVEEINNSKKSISVFITVISWLHTYLKLQNKLFKATNINGNRKRKNDTVKISAKKSKFEKETNESESEDEKKEDEDEDEEEMNSSTDNIPKELLICTNPFAIAAVYLFINSSFSLAKKIPIQKTCKIANECIAKSFPSVSALIKFVKNNESINLSTNVEKKLVVGCLKISDILYQKTAVLKLNYYAKIAFRMDPTYCIEFLINSYKSKTENENKISNYHFHHTAPLDGVLSHYIDHYVGKINKKDMLRKLKNQAKHGPYQLLEKLKSDMENSFNKNVKSDSNSLFKEDTEYHYIVFDKNVFTKMKTCFHETDNTNYHVCIIEDCLFDVLGTEIQKLNWEERLGLIKNMTKITINKATGKELNSMNIKGYITISYKEKNEYVTHTLKINKK